MRNGDSEFSFVLSRSRVKPGPALVQYVNTGEDPHDLVLKKKGGQRVRRSDEVLPAGQAAFELRLKARSRYLLWCSLDGHKEAGMKATIKVKRRS